MVEVGTGSRGTKIINKDYPVEEGITAGTTKQTGKTMNLIPQTSSKVEEIEKEGIY